MALNDANHALTVENQLGHLAAVLDTLSGPRSSRVPVIQPISLGSDALPPFAGPDGSRITGVPGQTTSAMSVGLYSISFNPPNGVVPFFYQNQSCKPNAPFYNLWACTGANANVSWYYKSCLGLPSCVFIFNATGGATFTLNYVLNNTSINVTAAGNGGGVQSIGIYGSHDNATLSVGGGTVENISIIGNYDNVTLFGTGNQNYNVLIVGNGDTFTANLKQGSSNTVRVNGWGTNLTTIPGAGGNFNVYYTGFDLRTSNGLCPMDDLAKTYDKVVQPLGTNNNGKGVVTFNDTSGGNSTVINGFWTEYFTNPISFPCIFYATFHATAVSGLLPASIVVDLQNRYAPYTEVALDQGAVVYAQAGAVPVLIDPPPVQYNPISRFATVWAPAFLTPVTTQQGTGTSVVTLNQFVSQNYSFPSGGWLVNPTKPLRLSYQTPYYAAWMNYFCGNAVYAKSAVLNLTVAGSPVSQNCTAFLNPVGGHANDLYTPYKPGGLLGSVTVIVPARAVLLKVSEYAVSAAT